ncbi:MAG: FHA domain-containing protein, partial [Microbacterium sp.]|nr:FHA domain-containing protein [Microbacterium sp.]
PAPAAPAPEPAAPAPEPAPPASEPAPPASEPAPAAFEPAGPWSRRAAPALIDSSAVLTAGSADTWIPQDATLAPEPDEATIDDVPASATTGYDHLWGATVVRSVEDAAVRAVDDDGGGEVDGDEATPDAADHADTVASARERGDHDGETISVARARALRDAAGAATDLGDADSVPPLAPPRPAAPGRLLLSTGQLVPLDRTVVIGRRPRSTRVTGTDLPHLIAVASPEQDISRSHIEVRVEGDSILVTDLNTTNGTTLRRLGTDPVRIHPGERTVVVPGDVLDLGDGVTVTVEGIE